MLVELRVRDLGVIDDQTIVLGPGMTALTGETGAGKTLVVEAIGLLLGARADPVLVRPGASEAVVEGRFVSDEGEEIVLGRTVPAGARSRAYVDGRMATSAALAETAAALVDLHGQHAHQSLLAPAVQRSSLDAAGSISLDAIEGARFELQRLDAEAAELGGDARGRAREIDLLRFQLTELEGASVDDPDEDDQLRDQEARLADASALREAAYGLHALLSSDDGVADQLAAALASLSLEPLEGLRAALAGLVAETTELAHDALHAAESFEDDPARLVEIGERRRTLGDLRRKYGDTLGEVIAYRDEARRRLDELESHGERAAANEAARSLVLTALADAEAAVGKTRRKAAGPLGRAVEARLRELAMPRARFEVEVGDDRAGSAVTWLLAANPGEPALPLAKVASGGELARTMLAARLVLTSAGAGWGKPRTLVFDEVDAGIGGEAAIAVGQALAALGRYHQVLVVTHLPQVAAVADQHLVVSKDVVDGRTISRLTSVDGDDRVAELSRMLSGRPDSVTAREHAAELLGSSAPGAKAPPRRRSRSARA
jgi:DNA repair protein RecN (Recombination protein N)